MRFMCTNKHEIWHLLLPSSSEGISCLDSVNKYELSIISLFLKMRSEIILK